MLDSVEISLGTSPIAQLRHQYSTSHNTDTMTGKRDTIETKSIRDMNTSNRRLTKGTSFEFKGHLTLEERLKVLTEVMEVGDATVSN